MTDEKKASKEELEHSVPLDLNLVIDSDKGEIDKVVDEVYSQLSLEPHNQNKVKNNLKVLILNLADNYTDDKNLYTGVHLNEKKYIASRYNKCNVTKSLPKLIHALAEKEFIAFHIGFRNPKISRITRIKPNYKLMKLIEEQGVNPDLITRHPETETVVCQERVKVEGSKNKIKIPLSYEDTDEAKSFRKLMVDYNNLLNKSHIDVYDQPNDKGVMFGKRETPVKINQNKKFVRRIFNDDKFQTNGRLYGGFWQQLNSKWRRKVAINGAATTEVDFSSMGINTLYDKYELPKDLSTDAYDLTSVGYDYGKYSFEEIRPLLKYCLMIMVNSESKEQAMKAIYEVMEKNDDLPMVTITPLIDAFTKRHEPIKHLFYQSLGGMQYRMDSEICCKIISFFLYEIKVQSKALRTFNLMKQKFIDKFGNKNFKGFEMPDGKGGTMHITEEMIKEHNPYDKGGIPILTVHDSFIVQSDFEDILRWQMEAQYKLEMNLKWNAPVDTKTEWIEQGKEEHINTTGIKWEKESFRIEDKDEAIKKMKEKYPELKDAQVNEIDIDQVAPQVRKEELEWDKDFQKRCDDFYNTSKYLTKDYYKLLEEPKHHIYINNWQYIEPNKEDMPTATEEELKELIDKDKFIIKPK